MTSPATIEPYAARFRVHPAPADPQAFTCRLLEELAERAETAGASIIGHIKCRARTPAGTFYCNLTSLRSGPRCRAAPGAEEYTEDHLELDLALLVYGLDYSTVAGIVAETLASCRQEGLRINTCARVDEH